MKDVRDWKDKVRTLEAMIEDIIEKQDGKNKEEIAKLSDIIDILYEYNISNITIGDIIVLMEKELGKEALTDDKSIIAFIVDENNREKLMSYGDSKNPIETSINDIEHVYSYREKDEFEPTDYEI